MAKTTLAKATMAKATTAHPSQVIYQKVLESSAPGKDL